jgi:hypothetical protein
MHRRLTLLGVFLLLLLLTLNACLPSPHIFDEERKELAKQLGVNADDYGVLFPVDYYDNELSRGTPIEKVHEAIQGYEKVVHCRYGIEIYYFYSSSDNLAVRMEVSYGPEGEALVGISGEDWNERDISTEDCTPGRIGDAPN